MAMHTENITQLGLLKISGQDACQFLQGQLTNDVTLLGKNWQFSGYCNPKGRLIALLILWQQGDDFYALLHQSLLESVQKRLAMYVMRSKVTISEVQEPSLLGIHSEAELKSLTSDSALDYENILSNGHGEITLSNDIACLRINNRFLLVGDKTLKESRTNADPENTTWQQADIAEGLPQVTDGSTELFIPQMLNLDLLNGINFKKGCYTGQEIVARMHYLGKLKQRMFVCDYKTNNNQEFQPGDKIYAGQEQSKTAGTMVSIDPHNQRLLAVLRLDQIESDLFLDSDTKITVDTEQPTIA